MKVIFLGLPDYSELVRPYAKRLCEHEGEVCEAIVEIESEEFSDGYYDLLFSDGFRAYDISGYDLEELLWKHQMDALATAVKNEQ